ncbi:MAG: zeta toxin family protein [Candidatus Kaiserbacteria bacterium]|nr:zeta toxin family protein [Candidatus Kaiserbacteria bacterium]
MSDEETIRKSVQWVEENKDSILQNVVLDRKPQKAKKCIFMAGSPGAGKTETVRRLRLRETFTVLEADEIRELNPFYTKTDGTKKGNAHLMQKAASAGLQYCRKYCIDEGIAFMNDTTFSNRGSIDLVKNLLNRGWRVSVLFVFRHPQKAWGFTKVRESKEGRHVPAESFAESFTGMVANIQHIQKKYKNVRILFGVREGAHLARFVDMKDNPHILVENKIDTFDKNTILHIIQNGV